MNRMKEKYRVWLFNRYEYSIQTKRTYWYLIHAMDLDNLDSYLLQQRQNDKDSTFNLRIAALRNFCEFLSQMGYGNDFVAKVHSLRPIRSPSKVHHKPYSKREVGKILANATGWQRVALHVALYSGLRKNEIRRLNLEDVILDQKKLIVRKGKGGKYREVVITTELESAIRRWLVQRESIEVIPDELGNPLIVTSRRKRPNFSSGNVFQKLNRKIGFKVSLHRCRATYATFLYLKTKDTKLIKDQLGHASLETTDAYIHSLIENHIKTITELGDIYK